MLFPWLVLASLASPVAPLRGGDVQEPAVSTDATAVRDAVRWFPGTFDEALAKARVENRQVVLVFRVEDCKRCDEFARKTLAQASVVAELADAICLSIDGESASGSPLVARFGVADYPTVVWLGSDGALRDRLIGAVPATEFLREVQRVRSDRETVGELRRRVQADESNVDLRWRLAQKLRAGGDGAGAEEQIARIKKLDPTGRSKPMRLMRLDELRTAVRRTYDESRGAFDTSSIAALLEHDTDTEVLFRGWSIVADFEAGALARIQKARQSTPTQAAAARARQRGALKRAWSCCPTDEIVGFGNQLAWVYFEGAEELGTDDKQFARAVAQRAAELAGDDPTVLDTLACCSFMNGDKDEALRLVRRCLELDPTNEQWKVRLEEFSS